MRRGPWKLVGTGGKVELFNLDDNIGESRDLADQYPQRVKQLRAAFDAWQRDVDRPSDRLLLDNPAAGG